MKENNFKIIFFTIIIILMIFSIYYVLKNQGKNETNIELRVEEKLTDSNFSFGILKPDTFNPILSGSQDIQYISKLIYDPLIKITEDFNLESGLAME